MNAQMMVLGKRFLVNPIRLQRTEAHTLGCNRRQNTFVGASSISPGVKFL